MSFESIIGNKDIKEMLKEAIKQNNILHSYMFIGTEGIGKKMIANEFAKMILCSSEKLDNKPCNNCKSCLEFNNSNNPDFVEINPDGNSIKIEQIREIQKKIIEKPIISNKKVYIINDSETMTKDAQNCLLKTLEEPPEYVVIILITSNENLMLNTIKSRCTKINFCKLSTQEIEKIYKSKFNNEEISKEILSASEGSIGKALQFQNNKELYEKINDILENIDKISLIDLVSNAENIYKEKTEIYDILNYINVNLYNLMFKNPEKYEIYTKSIEIVEETKKKLKANTNYDMSIDFLLFKLWEELNK